MIDEIRSALRGAAIDSLTWAAESVKRLDCPPKAAKCLDLAVQRLPAAPFEAYVLAEMAGLFGGKPVHAALHVQLQSLVVEALGGDVPPGEAWDGPDGAFAHRAGSELWVTLPGGKPIVLRRRVQRD